MVYRETLLPLIELFDYVDGGEGSIPPPIQNRQVLLVLSPRRMRTTLDQCWVFNIRAQYQLRRLSFRLDKKVDLTGRT